MRSPLGSSLANAFLAYHKQNWLDDVLQNMDHYITDNILIFCTFRII